VFCPVNSDVWMLPQNFPDETYINAKGKFYFFLKIKNFVCRTVFLQLYQYEVYEKEHAIQPAYWVGYIRHNVIQRRVYNQQKQFIEDQYVTENHAIMMYEPFLFCKNENSE